MVPEALLEHFLLWAKTVPGDPRLYHPLGYHSLDVGAVAQALIARDRHRFAALAAALSAPLPTLARLTTLLVALHDIGKASLAFQWKARAFWPAALLGPRPSFVADHSHGELTAWYLAHGPLEEMLDRLTPDWESLHRGFLIDAVAGHHGRPVARKDGVDETFVVGRKLKPVARVLAEELAAVIGVEPVALGPCDTDHPIISYAWYVATLLPLADWIASNAAWFPAMLPELSLADYWEICARPRAQAALARSGIGHAASAMPDPTRILPEGGSPSPAQAWASEVLLPKAGPMLAIVEDATGSGKTEAALILAHRLMHAGLASGFYLALPTMATANAMFGRLEDVYAGLFEPDSQPSLVLAHGRARRNRDFLASVRPERLLGNGREEDVAGYCNSWIADDRRKAFLAQAGAGTIDQAVLAILPSKYQTLRLRGLADKVLIVDEAHAFDAYLSTEVEGLLAFHAAQGGSAIILSATLPLKTRNKLIAAFAKGAGWKTSAPVRTAYPLATSLTAAGLTEAPLTTSPDNDRVVRVERVESVGAGEAMVLDLAAKGAAVALIRSTVDAAIETFGRLSARTPDAVGVDLFHARFLPSDRDAIERRVMKLFGKKSSAEDRRGKILVATQVIEQSLDIDFDAIVSDLAPVDLLIQRAGRLWRHRARDSDRPVPEAVLRVVSADPLLDKRPTWLDETLVEARWVYGDPSLLWLSAKTLFGVGSIVTGALADEDMSPAHVRRLVEAVYGHKVLTEKIPPELHPAAEAAEGKQLSHRSVAKYFLLSPFQPYERAGQPWADDSKVSTRLDDGSRAVRIAIEEAGHFVPFGRDLDGKADWVASELRLRPRLCRGLTPPTQEQASRFSPAWAEADQGVLLLVMDRDADGARSLGERGLRYTARRGLASTSDETTASN